VLKAKHTKHTDWKTKTSNPKHSLEASLSHTLFEPSRAPSSCLITLVKVYPRVKFLSSFLNSWITDLLNYLGNNPYSASLTIDFFLSAKYGPLKTWKFQLWIVLQHKKICCTTLILTSNLLLMSMEGLMLSLDSQIGSYMIHFCHKLIKNNETNKKCTYLPLICQKISLRK